MFPFVASALIIVTFFVVAWKMPSRPKMAVLMLRLLVATSTGVAIGSLDYFIEVFTRNYRYAPSYLEWQYPQFALECLACALLVYAVIITFAGGKERIATLAISSVLGFWLAYSGLVVGIRGLFDYSGFGIADAVASAFGFERMTEDRFVRRFLVYTAASAVFLVLLFAKNSFFIRRPITPSTQEVVVRFKSSPNEPARLLMGLAAAGRLPKINKLRQEQNHPCLASPFPMDVDRTTLIALANERDKEMFGNRVGYFVLAVIAVASGLTLFVPGVCLAILGAGILAFRQTRQDRETLVPAYQPDSFKPPKAPDDADGAQNLVTYSGYDPFSQFGMIFGTWVLVVDTTRAKQDGLDSAEPREPDLEKIERQIGASTTQAGQIVGDPQPLYFVQGKNIPEPFLRNRSARPPQHFPASAFSKFAEDPDAPIRRYLWIRKSIWGREITISYFIRLFRHGSDLNLEINGVIMPPVAENFRWVDQFAPQGPWDVMFEFIASLFVGAWMMVVAPFYAMAKFQEGLAKALGGEERALKNIRTSVERTANFDFGAPLGIRRQVAAFGPVQYFQNMDRRAAEAAFAGRVTRSFIDYLDTCNIDTSELREQRTTLLNQGIMVQGGDVKADNLAVGAGAKVKALGQQARQKVGGGQ